ncbi:unnamed protein product [Lymnaea stagnalis]|uniref:adenosine deaminase n=1 Tax=Lymnaea stagnalis TaxID=6523 RepID=A0AAV2IRJ0_LYMST
MTFSNWKVRHLLGVLVLMASDSLSMPISKDDYLKMRSELISQDEKMRIGGDLALSPDELIVNGIFMKEKRQMIEESRQNRTVFVPSTSFYQSKKLIDQTALFQLIQKLPKGAALHLHDQSMVSLDWIVKNATYRDNVYMCLGRNNYLMFKVFHEPPQNDVCHWKLVQKERESSHDVEAFDLNLNNNLSLVDTDPYDAFPDNQAAWLKFKSVFDRLGPLLNYVPIYRDMVWRTLEEFREANVQYLEIRGGFTGLYDTDGTVHDARYGVQLIKSISDDFVNKYPDFTGVKIIPTGIRNQNVSQILEEVKTTMALHKEFPDVVSGYDLAGNEALYQPLSYYSEALLYPSQQDPPYHLPYFFHAGETPWQGTETGFNLADAILLNATRVGHAYALSKHPKFLQLILQKGIPVEVQPITNQILRLLDDFRNHPMVSLMAQNLPLVISCDDRTTMGLAPLSHDFFVAFTAMSSEDADLTLLKQLAINSIKFSSLDPAKKEKAMELWEKKWYAYIDDVIRQSGLASSARDRRSVAAQGQGLPNNGSTLFPPWAFILLLFNTLI